MESVPDEMVVFTGLVLSVKVPKVPMPATAAAAPRTPSEPTTLRAVGLSVRFLILVLMSVSPLSLLRCATGDSGDRENSGGPTAGHPLAFRKESARLAPGSLGSADSPGFRAFPPLATAQIGDAAPVAGGGDRGNRAEDRPRDPDFSHLARSIRVAQAPARGSVSVKVVPSPSALSTSRTPSCAVVMALVMASPRPTPGTAMRWAVDARKKRVKSLPCSPVGMPMPVSRTARWATGRAPGRSAAQTVPSGACQAARNDSVTRPPAGVNFTALETRLSHA